MNPLLIWYFAIIRLDHSNCLSFIILNIRIVIKILWNFKFIISQQYGLSITIFILIISFFIAPLLWLLLSLNVNIKCSLTIFILYVRIMLPLLRNFNAIYNKYHSNSPAIFVLFISLMILNIRNNFKICFIKYCHIIVMPMIYNWQFMFL